MIISTMHALCARFRAPSAHRSLLRQAEATRYLAALRRQAEAKGSALFKVSDLFSTADSLDLAVPDMHAFIEELNYGGE